MSKFYIGWDVGGWNCDKNPNSRDAITILDAQRKIIGQPWRGNIKHLFNSAANQKALITQLFHLCKAEAYLNNNSQLIFGIDTPLGFSKEFLQLLTDPGFFIQSVDGYAENQYVFRQTDRYLFSLGLKPLSPINDMIGSQATKGIHFLNKYISANATSVGVWKGGAITAIEAYPSACKKSLLIHGMLDDYLLQPAPGLQACLPEVTDFLSPIGHEDIRDSLVCALVAYLFEQDKGQLIQPDSYVSVSEGWIFAPKDGLGLV